MFDNLVTAASPARGAGAVGAWARVENAAAARRLSAMADVLEAMLSADGSANREQWCLDNWDAVSAEVAAAQGVSSGVASNELLVAWELRERMPRVAEVFASGRISYRLVKAVVVRTRLIIDVDARAKIDIEIAAQVASWGSLSVAKVETEIDYWVDRFDPYALTRTESKSRTRRADVNHAKDGSGMAYIEAVLFGHDAATLDGRLDELAHSVCDGDPRTIDQRRADAFGALGATADQLRCECGVPDCPGAGRVPSAVVIHVIAEEASLADDSAVALDGVVPPNPNPKPIREMTLAEALAPSPPTGPAKTNPAAMIGRGILPAPLLAAKLAGTAVIRRLVHPGQSPPEPRYVPSQRLADFVRCRDMTCRFPGCDIPADRCDLDHTIAYPVGPTQASNLKCLCRKHHLLKSFWRGWADVQSPGGTVVWTSPGGQTYTTNPGSMLLFPTLCRPTAPVVARADNSARVTGLGMPRRERTRAQGRALRIDELRRLNEPYVAERNKPPPF